MVLDDEADKTNMPAKPATVQCVDGGYRREDEKGRWGGVRIRKERVCS